MFIGFFHVFNAKAIGLALLSTLSFQAAAENSCLYFPWGHASTLNNHSDLSGRYHSGSRAEGRKPLLKQPEPHLFSQRLHGSLATLPRAHVSQNLAKLNPPLRLDLMHTTTPSTTSGDLLSPAGLAERFGVHVSTIRRIYREGKIPGLKIGPRSTRFSLRAVLDAFDLKERVNDRLNGEPA